jgi:hypothetical protein
MRDFPLPDSWMPKDFGGINLGYPGLMSSEKRRKAKEKKKRLKKHKKRGH